MQAQPSPLHRLLPLDGGVAHDLNNLLSIITTYTTLILEDLEPDHPSRSDLDEIRQAAERAIELTRQLKTSHSPWASTDSARAPLHCYVPPWRFGDRALHAEIVDQAG